MDSTSYSPSIVLLRLSSMVIDTKAYPYMYWGLLPTPSPLNPPVKTPTLCLPWTHTQKAKHGWRNYTTVLTLYVWGQISVPQSYRIPFVNLPAFSSRCYFKPPLLSKHQYSSLLRVEGLSSYFLEANRSNWMRISPMCTMRWTGLPAREPSCSAYLPSGLCHLWTSKSSALCSSHSADSGPSHLLLYHL